MLNATRAKRRATPATFVAATIAILTSCNFGAFSDAPPAGDTICRCTCSTDSNPDGDPFCLETCKEPFDSAHAFAVKKGCDGEYKAYAHCLETNGRCVDRSFDAPECGSKFALVTECEVDGSDGGGGGIGGTGG